jgi:hypothetical protein
MENSAQPEPDNQPKVTEAYLDMLRRGGNMIIKDGLMVVYQPEQADV